MGDFTKFSDQQLILLLKQDKLSAFKEIYARYWKKLYSESYKRLKDKELAEEVVQEIFTNFWLKRQSLQITTTITGYLYLAVANQVIDRYRKELVRSKYRETFKVVHSEVDNSTEDTIMLKELTSTIETEVNQLPDRCRSVYELSRNEYKTNKEIATYLGISEKTVENQLTKALKKLRLGLSHYLVVILIFFVK
ncbi:MAG: polymerase sigma-70 factor [Mucilaginibacter sp.]|jgi:RNA polymerase sigma-70 factor (family 1)|nr:polymerase sigma-70 factor [Mucilaginibacter sp.]MDB5015819.1 polymerase sigma-70 factor [Mucilaginibacter sp.]MDB5140348.1 polymerase sigma-70 factor [Mucilaginibacter sp.]